MTTLYSKKMKMYYTKRCSRPSRLLLVILASTVASSFVLRSNAIKGPRGSSTPVLSRGAFVGKKSDGNNFHRSNNPVLLLVGGAIDDAHDDTGFESDEVSSLSSQQQQHPDSLASPPPTPSLSPPASTSSDSVTALDSTITSPSLAFPLLGPNARQPPGILRRTFPNFPWQKLPDLLTYLRCLAIPLFVGLFYLPDNAGRNNLYVGTIFAIASATDWLDGYLARRWDISTSFGAFLDPVADKLMVSTSLILLSGRYGSIVAFPTTIILAREIAVSALREWMAQRGERNIVKVGIQGKIKTALTMFALSVLLFVPSSSTSTILFKLGIPLLYLSALVTITSGSVYFIAAAPALMGTKK